MSDKSRNLDNEVNNETAIKEVQQLLKMGVVDLSPDIINRLRSKYSDDNVVDAIMESFSDRRHKINKVAVIFVEAFQRKYKNDFFSMSLSKFMKRALKYKTKYNLSNEELEEAKRVFEMKIFNSSSMTGRNVVYPNTNLSRVLGYPVVESTDIIKPSNTDDYAYLQEIIKLYQVYRSSHSYIVIQTMTYTGDGADLNIVTDSTFENKYNPNIHVHPLIVALFVPKIKVLEERMLYANIAGIINTRYNSQRIITKPDFELFYSMVIDPADVICDNVSAMRDLKSRVDVQVQLWNNVYNLRLGKCYEASSIEFMAYIDKCKISTVDNPDLVYLSDEGVILRRLFSIFALRTITVKTIPLLNNFNVSANPLNIPVTMSTLTTVPYLIYRIPEYTIDPAQELTLDDLITNPAQPSYYMENGMYIPKITQVLSAYNLIIIYVPRKKIALPYTMAPNMMGVFDISSYQNSAHNYHQLNNQKVNYSSELTTTDSNKFYLRSVVLYDTKDDNGTNIIVGHKTVICDASGNETHIYKPRNAINSTNKKVFIEIASESDIKDQIDTKGTIFVYSGNK